MRARATTAVITQLPGRSFLVSVDPISWALSTAADIAAHAINIHNFFQTSLLLVLCPVGVPGYYIAVKHALSFASLRGWQHCWNRNEEKSEQEKQHDLYTYNKSAMTTSSKVCLAKVWEKKLFKRSTYGVIQIITHGFQNRHYGTFVVCLPSHIPPSPKSSRLIAHPSLPLPCYGVFFSMTARFQRDRNLIELVWTIPVAGGAGLLAINIIIRLVQK